MRFCSPYPGPGFREQNLKGCIFRVKGIPAYRLSAAFENM